MKIKLKQDTSIFLSGHNLSSPKMKINAYLAMLIPLITHKTNPSIDLNCISATIEQKMTDFINIQMHKISFKNYHSKKSVF